MNVTAWLTIRGNTTYNKGNNYYMTNKELVQFLRNERVAIIMDGCKVDKDKAVEIEEQQYKEKIDENEW